MRTLAPVFAAALLAGACAGDPPPIATGTSGALGANVTGETSENSGGFNPFAEQPSASSGARQIIANPSLAEVIQPGTLPEFSLGRADAPVTFIKYASLTCPHCKAFHRSIFPEFKRTYIDTGKVRFIIREFPIGKTAGNATIALRCAPMDKYLALYGKFLEQQASWVSQEVRLDAIYAVAQQVGMTRPEFDQCLQNQGMIDALKGVKDRGRTLGIIGTPNFFINNKLVKSTLTMAEIRAQIDPLLAGAPAATANAGPPG